MKIIKLSLVILLVLAVLFFGGAWLLPQNQSFFTGFSVKTDPVAIFSELSELNLIESLHTGKDRVYTDSIHIISTEKFKSVRYKVYNQGFIPEYRGGFNIEKEDESSRIIWFYSIDSLSYPVDRWKGLFESVVLKRKYNERTSTLKESILK